MLGDLLKLGAFSLQRCLGSILLLSIVPVIVMLQLIRQGAAAIPTFSGALVGLIAAIFASRFCKTLSAEDSQRESMWLPPGALAKRHPRFTAR